MTKQIFRIPTMHCSSCVMVLEELEEELLGIKNIRASYHQQQLVVDYDEEQVTEAQIIAAIRELGYEAIPHTKET